MENEQNSVSEEVENKQFPCSKCGAFLVFAPGTHSLTCPYCGEKNEVANEAVEVVEDDFESVVNSVMENDDLNTEISQIKCGTCGAISALPPNTVSSDCAFCGTALVVSQSTVKRMIKPKYVLPFQIAKNKCNELFKGWINGRFWAPNAIKKQSEQGKIQGLYIPYWTYDCDTNTDYTGERGDHYTVIVERDGKNVSETRTRWSFRNGSVSRFFDDILICASNSLPQKLKNKLNEWDFKELMPYNDQYLSGFTTEIYQIGLNEGFEQAKEIIKPKILEDVRNDIGGNEQRVSNTQTAYSNITFKHLLLPIWLTSYKYNNKSYSILINGQTGEIEGNYPVSVWKVIIAVLLGLGVIAALYFIL
jgi:hypothetical protein